MYTISVIRETNIIPNITQNTRQIIYRGTQESQVVVL